MEEMNWDEVKIKKRPHIPPVGDYIDSVLRNIKSNQKEDGLAELQSIWSTVTGERIGRVCYPTRLKDGTLTIKVSSAVWRQELHSQSSIILGNIKDKMPSMPVENIIFR